MRHTLGIDVGTFESKGVLADETGRIVARAARPHRIAPVRPRCQGRAMGGSARTVGLGRLGEDALAERAEVDAAGLVPLVEIGELAVVELLLLWRLLFFLRGI